MDPFHVTYLSFLTGRWGSLCILLFLPLFPPLLLCLETLVADQGGVS